MAINFLNSINLNQNELIKARIENQPNNTAAGTGVEGQLYYDTTLDVLKVWANGAWVEVGGGVTSFTATDGTFINLTPNTTQGGAATLTADLSATGTPDSSSYLRGDNTWAPVSAIPGTYAWSIQGGTGGPTTVTSGTNITFAGGANVTTALVGNTLTINSSNASITLTGDVTGTGTTSIATTIASGAVEFSMMDPIAIVTSGEGIPSNDNDVTLPTSAAVKAYVDASVAGGLIYQGGYDAATNTPNLDSPPTIAGIKKGWTYTVTVEGTFFTEQVRVGDVLIAEIDTPTTLADWTTVQNNIDLASLTQVGIGNVNAGTGIGVSYTSGTATVTNTDLGSSQNIFKNIAVAGQSTIVADSNNDTLTLVAGTGKTLTTDDTTDTVTITAPQAGRSFTNTGPSPSASTTYTIDSTTHGLGTDSSVIMVQLVQVSTGETIYSDVTRGASGLITITFAASQTANSIRALLQKIG